MAIKAVVTRASLSTAVTFSSVVAELGILYARTFSVEELGESELLLGHVEGVVQIVIGVRLAQLLVVD